MTEEYCSEKYIQKQRHLEVKLKWINEPFDSSESHYSLVNAPNGDVYEGEVVAGKRHGRGTLHSVDGSDYKGNWLNNCCHGMGWHKSATDNTVYIGEWADNCMQARHDVLLINTAAIKCNSYTVLLFGFRPLTFFSVIYCRDMVK